EPVDDGDDRQRDARGNQAVFDGGGAGFVVEEFVKDTLQWSLQAVASGRSVPDAEPDARWNLRGGKSGFRNFMRRRKRPAELRGWLRRFHRDRRKLKENRGVQGR